MRCRKVSVPLLGSTPWRLHGHRLPVVLEWSRRICRGEPAHRAPSLMPPAEGASRAVARRVARAANEYLDGRGGALPQESTASADDTVERDLSSLENGTGESMNVTSATSGSAAQSLQRTPESSEAQKVGPDHDGDADDGAKAAKPTPGPRVNTSGQPIGQVVDVSV